MFRKSEYVKILKEAVVAYIKVLSQHLPEEIEENNKNLSGCLQEINP
jgi:hypothetical protein